MAENGVFRSAFRGFNKQDVLEYIDRMQAAAARNLENAEARAREAEERSTELTAEVRTLRAQVQETEEASQTELQSTKEQNEKLTALAQMYKRELVQLRDKLTATELRVADTDALQAEIVLLRKQNEQYARVVGDVSRVVMQARVVSASYFDNAHKSSLECLGQLRTFLEDLKVKTAEAVKTADVQHEESGDTIDTLLEQLQQVEIPEAE